MKTDWLEIKWTPGVQIFCLFFLLFLGMIIGGVFTKLFVGVKSSITNPYSFALVLCISSVSLFLLPSLICMYVLRFYRSQAIFNRKINLVGVLLAVVLVFICMPILGLVKSGLGTFSVESFSPELQHFFDSALESSKRTFRILNSDQTAFSLLINIVVLAVTPALAEELFFRGCLQTSILRMVKSYHVGIWITALVFSVMHFRLDGFVNRILLGAILGYLYFWGKNLIYPIFFHFVNNALVVVTLFRAKGEITDEIDYLEKLGGIMYLFCFLSAVLSGLILFYFYKYYRKKCFDTEFVK